MKRYFLYIFLFIFIVGFLISPSIGIAGDEKIQLSINEKEFILNLVQKKLKQQAMLMWADPDIIPEKQASFVVIQRAIEKEMFSFFFVEAPKKVTIDVVKTIFKIVQVFYGGEVSANILSEIEKMSVEKAINYLTQYLLKYEIKIANGNLDYSYISYKGTSQKTSFQYIITYQNLENNKAKVVIEFYSPKTIEPPRFTNATPSDLGKDLKPFILRVRGNLGEESGGYYWLEEPKIEVVFNEPVPDLGFKEPNFFDKLKNRLNEIETAFKKAIEMLTNIFDDFNPFQAALNPVVPENIVSEIPEIDISEINLENLLPIAEKIEEVEEKLSTGTEGTGDRTSEINLEEVQKMLEEIGKEVEILSQNIQEIAQEQGIGLEQGFSGRGQGGIGQQIVFSTGASGTRSQNIEFGPESESEAEPEEQSEPELESEPDIEAIQESPAEESSADVGAGSPSPEEEGEEASPLQPEPEPEPEPEDDEEEEEEEQSGLEPEPLTDITPPEVIFELEPVQITLSFTLNWTATDPMDSVSPSGIDGFYLQYQVPGLETTTPSDGEGIALWYQDEDEDWQDWPIGKILELGSDKENLFVLGKDEYTYNFQLQARDKTGNVSQWQEVSTTITIPKEEPPVFLEKIIYVDDDFEDDPVNHRWNTIQKGIDDAKLDYLVLVSSGIYRENLVIEKPNLIIRSEQGAETTIIQTADQSKPILEIKVEQTEINGFAIKGNIGYQMAGIYADNMKNLLVKENKFSENYIGLHLVHSTENTVQNNIFEENRFGIYLENSQNNTLIKNSINSKRYSWHETVCGIYLNFSDNNNLEENITNDKGYSDAINHGPTHGICLISSKENILKNNKSQNNKGMGDGIYLKDSDFNRFEGNFVAENQVGINLINSNSNNLENNKTENNNIGIYFDPNSNENILKNNLMDNSCIANLDVFSQNNEIDESNLVDGKVVYFLKNQSDLIIDSSLNPGLVYCFGCQNITIKDLTIDNRNNTGIYFYRTNDSLIENVNISESIVAIYLKESNSNTIKNNLIKKNFRGISLLKSDNNKILDNLLEENDSQGYSPCFGTSPRFGLSLGQSSQNEIFNNLIFNNPIGVKLEDSSTGNTLFENTIKENKNGINVYCSANNLFYHSNFINNEKNEWGSCIPYPPKNQWYHLDLNQGNYYSDYDELDEGCEDSNGDNICDTGYFKNNDEYPFLEKNGWQK